MTELGSRLREEREAKGLSLDELQSITKIQKRYLLGIEEGNYSMMPGKFYVRAFIKQYAEAVGLEPDELFEEYKNDIPSTYNEDLPEQLSRVQTRKSISPGTSKFLDLLPKILIAAFVVGSLVLVWYIFQKNAGDNTQDPVTGGNDPAKFEESEELADNDKNAGKDKNKAEDKGAGSKEEEANKEEPKEEPEKPAQELTMVEANGRRSVYELKNAEKFELKVVSTGETWVNIKNGSGTSLFQGMLKKGATESNTQDLTNDTEAVIVVGFAPATEIYVNGQKLEYAVPATEQMRQDITIRYVKAAQ
ncbi:helix-turn-helix domain-containing protein [Bacillus sp. T33-2]|uniref:helix-turn-helix domain-containing protein n=1 Tax=Bacillus sp. T33-2 TaxID=2054168 RepID=UPI000C767217|nr:helix-turn-helix domain-containing protein [Bacillus sp. T33-2]PLR94886.1 helix-turn-helix domain-containing protein [Bacillus sp. T33-2]